MQSDVMTPDHTQSSAGLSTSVEKRLRAYFAAHEGELPSAGLYGRVIQEVEIPLISIALEECGGNQLRAAALLGLNRNTLRKKMRELGLVDARPSRRNPKTRRHRSHT